MRVINHKPSSHKPYLRSPKNYGSHPCWHYNYPSEQLHGRDPLSLEGKMNCIQPLRWKILCHCLIGNVLLCMLFYHSGYIAQAGGVELSFFFPWATCKKYIYHHLWTGEWLQKILLTHVLTQMLTHLLTHAWCGRFMLVAISNSVRNRCHSFLVAHQK